jgi:CBS domain-containing protein
MTPHVKTVREDTLVREAAALMRTEEVGVLPVIGRGDKLVGLVTDRDLVVRAFGREDEQNLRVRDVMTRDLEVVAPEEPIDDVAERMRYHMVQRLPVVDRAGYLLGIVSIDDIAARSAQPREVRRTMASFAERGPAEIRHGWEEAEEGVPGWGPPGGPAGRVSFGRRASGWQREPLTAREVMRSPARAVTLGTALPEVVSIMTQENVGILPVIDQDKKLKGVITDRDVLVRVSSANKPVQDVPVEKVMTAEVETAHPEDTIGRVIEKMGQEAVHRLPVVSHEGRLVGIISIDDVAQRADYDEEIRDALSQMAGRRSFWRRLANWSD